MELQARENNIQIPYLFDNYKTRAYYPESAWHNNNEDVYLADIYNSLVDALNDPIDYHLPRYLLIFLDHEMVEAANIFDYGAAETFRDLIKWLLININEALEYRKSGLLKKKPGAVSTASEPRLVWITMLRRPHKTTRKHIFALTRKFNETLEEVFSLDKRSHILKVHIEGNEANFSSEGNLTQIGQVNVWRAIDEEMRDFDHGKTELEPARIGYDATTTHPKKEYQQHHTSKVFRQRNKFRWHKKKSYDKN